MSDYDDKLEPSVTNSSYDPPLGVGLNKYSLWVAGAVNMGIIKISDLTDLADTSFASAYAGVLEDDAAAEDDFDDDEAAAGASSGDDEYVGNCPAATREYYADGWCDKPNNIEACNWDGGDCCSDTCIDGTTSW